MRNGLAFEFVFTATVKTRPTPSLRDPLSDTKKARRSGPFVYAVGHLITYQQLPIFAEDNREGIVELGVATSAIRAKLIREIGMQRLGKIGAGRIRAIF